MLTMKEACKFSVQAPCLKSSKRYVPTMRIEYPTVESILNAIDEKASEGYRACYIVTGSFIHVNIIDKLKWLGYRLPIQVAFPNFSFWCIEVDW